MTGIDTKPYDGDLKGAHSLPEASASSSVGAYYPWLDALRGLSWVLVMVGHSVPKVSYLARMGVGMFFAISGWLITQIILKQRASKWSLSGFYSRRWLRIVPLYYVLILVACLSSYLLPNWKDAVSYPPGGSIQVDGHAFKRVAVDLAPGDVPEHAMLSHLLTFATESWRPGGGGGSMIGHAWSLCVEERFYVFWPLILTLCPPIRSVQRGLIVGIIAVCYLAMRPLDQPHLNQALWAVPYPLLLGSALAIFWPKVQPVVPLYVTGPLAAILLTLYVAYARIGDKTVGPTINTFGLLAGLMAMALVACGVFTRGGPRNAVARGFLFLGPLSYAAYLFHVPFAIVGRQVALRLGLIHSVFVYIAPVVGVALCAAFAYLLHRCIELPILSRRKAIESRPWLRRLLSCLQVAPILVGLAWFCPWQDLWQWTLHATGIAPNQFAW